MEIKKNTWRKIVSYIMKITALVLIVCLVAPGGILHIIWHAAATETVLYLKELKIYETDSAASARVACQLDGYTFLDVDLNYGTDTEKYVYLGYKTTENRSEAVTKISLLEMNGGYQIKDYAVMYDEFEKNNYSAAETLQMASREFIANYENNSPKALDAYEGLNLLSVPEAGDMGLGDYIVKGKTSIDFYAKVITRSSGSVVSAIVNFLSSGLTPYKPPKGTGQEDLSDPTNWATAMADSVLWDILENGDLTEDELDEMRRMYDDDAKALFYKMQEFATCYENCLRTYNEDAFVEEAMHSDLETIVSEMGNGGDKETYPVYMQAYNLLNEFDANPDMPLGEWIVEMGKMTSDEVDLKQIYPMIDAMSYAQVRLTAITGFLPCASTLGENKRSEEFAATLTATQNKLKELVGNGSFSIWTNCDPDITDKKVAFTSDAIRQNAAEGIINGLADENDTNYFEEFLKWAGFLGSLLTVASFVFGKYFIGGALLLIAKYAACACLSTVASTMITICGYVSYYGGIASLALLFVTILYFAFKALFEYIGSLQPKAYTEIPEYVVDSVKTSMGYGNVNYKSVKNNDGGVGDLNGHKGQNGWVCLYTTTDERVGSPIRADENGNIFVAHYGDSSTPYDCEPVSYFGQVSAGNCNANAKQDGVNGIYINYYTEKSLKNRTPEGSNKRVDEKNEPQIEGETKYYYHKIIVKSAATEAVAKSKIIVEGYYIWDQNLSPNVLEGGQYTYIGYTLTTDPNDALRDIRVATYTPKGQIQFGSITYGCAGAIGFPATSKEENDEYPENLDGLFFTRNENAGTPIEYGKLHLVNSFSQAKDAWEPVTTFSGLIYNFATTYKSGPGILNFIKPGRWNQYPYQYIRYTCEEDYEWNETDAYLYYEPQTTYTSGTKYLSGIFFAFGTDSEDTIAFEGEVLANFSQLTAKIKTMPNAVVRDDINLAQSFNYKGYWPDSNQKYLHICYTWSYNPYRALYGIGAFQGTIYSSYLPYSVQKAVSYEETLSGKANNTAGYTSASVVVQRSTVHTTVTRAISPENAYMTTTGLLGQNTQVQQGYVSEKMGNYNYRYYGANMAFLPTGLYVSGYQEGKKALSLDDVVMTSNVYSATMDDKGVLSVDLSGENTLGGIKAEGTFASVQDIKNPYETSPFNLAYPSWTNDDGEFYAAGTAMYIYFRNTVVKKKYIARVFVGQSSRKSAETSDSDILKEFDKQVDLNALVAATAASSDEVVLTNVAVDVKDAWYNRYQDDKLGRMELKPIENQPAAYISVMRTDNPEEAIRGILLYKSSPDRAVPNQISVGGAKYYCASNNQPIRMSNGNSYYLYYSYNIGVSSGGPVTDIYADSEPLGNAQTTALVVDHADTDTEKAVPYGDTTMPIFIRAAYEKTERTYFNKLYTAVGFDLKEAQLKLLEQGCSEYFDINLNSLAGGNTVLLGYRSFSIDETAIRMKSSAEEKEEERQRQLGQAIYDIICTVGEPIKPEGILSQRYQIYYTPVVMVDINDKTKVTGVNFNDGTIGPEIYMYYATPYAAKEYNDRVKNEPVVKLSSMPYDYFTAPITKIAIGSRDRVPYFDDGTTVSSGDNNVLRWEYVMQSDNKHHVDLNDGVIYIDADKRLYDNRISMFVQRADGSVKPSAEITGGYLEDEEDSGIMINRK